MLNGLQFGLYYLSKDNKTVTFGWKLTEKSGVAIQRINPTWPAGEALVPIL